MTKLRNKIVCVKAVSQQLSQSCITLVKTAYYEHFHANCKRMELVANMQSLAMPNEYFEENIIHVPNREWHFDWWSTKV